MILKDDTHAIMEQADFDSLPEYSCSIPTGVFIGKIWKRREPYIAEPTHWFLGEYVEVEDKNMAGVKFREILLV
jgi:hypothetical protein